ncbi:CYTH and CHAD domain-containing protein [Catenuloplanes indicus]|uniref:CHAD domain-containing protein n=1 Tax=Catenuloplanes indicus TaxID=137267 RepID=A0AAE3W3Z2_9ACTN|nr:CYTH and CHAD domain-containing protein [Catenuloplanes indicus]MDQ0369009.1 CHAD domain-containing protein [Catenuloplanes indicus]
MLEEERKYEVAPEFDLPDLTGALPSGGRVVAKDPKVLTATYFDTEDLRLARAGVSLRFRKGDDEPWTVKLPADVPGTRHEISRAGKKAKTPPAEMSALVTPYARGEELVPAVVVRSARRAYLLQSGDGTVLAELDDDTVEVLDGEKVRSTFREVEVERADGDPALLDQVEALLVKAGATAGTFTPKHARAMGAAASAAPDLVPAGDLPDAPTAGDVVTAAIRDGIGRILAHDPLVRLGTPLPDGDTAVHQMRVGCRRLRSDLRTFGVLVKTSWARTLRDELGWIAGVLGAARDAEVLRARLRRTAALDPLAPLDERAVDRLDARLAKRQRKALAELDAALRTARYRKLVDLLVEAAREPKLSPDADAPAAEVLPHLVARPWDVLVNGGKGVAGAADLHTGDSDERWHGVRINGKRARYAVEAVAPVLGGPAAALGKALSKVQNLLGEHQDAAMAAQTWLDLAAEKPDDHGMAVTAGRLAERERAVIHAVRGAFPAAWENAVRPKKTAWLR